MHTINETLTRGLSGIIYVIIMMIGIYFYPLILFILIAVISIYEILRLKEKSRNQRLIKYFFLTYIILFFTSIIAPFIVSLPTNFIEYSYLRNKLLYIFCSVWIFDTFAYLIGRKIGRNKILPSVSPAKSWEGFIAGYIFTVIITILTYQVFIIETNLSISKLYYFLFFIYFICFFATLGDFSASFVKRRFKIKDFSNLIPGHGGILDRMDAFLIILPIFSGLELISYYTSIKFDFSIVVFQLNH